VGESGSGKSTTARLALRLLDPTAGRITFDGRDVTGQRGRALRSFRGDVQAVFQDATGSLDPTMTIGDHLVAAVRLHRQEDRSTARRTAADLLAQVGLDGRHLDRYPHEVSGGQRQRVGLARALAARPRLLVLDEPVSSLDVSTQSQAVNLLADLQRDLGLAYLLIAHDLPLVRHLSHRVAVMYLGAVVEQGVADQVYDAPRHPYTQALLSLVPALGEAARRPIVLAGEVPGPSSIPSGCRFRTRCPYAFEACTDDPPRLLFEDGGRVECHLHTAGPRLGGESVDLLLDDAGRPVVRPVRRPPLPANHRHPGAP
jgi:oligopeptide/dipeptide ABC transporter ATP-binding protein